MVKKQAQEESTLVNKIVKVKPMRELPGHLQLLPVVPVPGEKVLVLEVVKRQFVKVKNSKKQIQTLSKNYFQTLTNEEL